MHANAGVGVTRDFHYSAALFAASVRTVPRIDAVNTYLIARACQCFDETALFRNIVCRRPPLAMRLADVLARPVLERYKEEGRFRVALELQIPIKILEPEILPQPQID